MREAIPCNLQAFALCICPDMRTGTSAGVRRGGSRARSDGPWLRHFQLLARDLMSEMSDDKGRVKMTSTWLVMDGGKGARSTVLCILMSQ